jgi:hypothetical protein
MNTLRWFIKKYPNESERYYKISDCLHAIYDGTIESNQNNTETLLNWIDNYTKKKIGISPLMAVIATKQSTLCNN